MGKQIKPDEFVEFSGVVTSGHPLMRPKRSSALLQNFRVMPGQPNWIRLRGGRTLAYNGAGGGSWGQFFQFNRSAAGGGVYHLGRRYTGAVYEWENINTAILPYTLSAIEQIATGNGFDSSVPSPIASVRESVFWDNGLGVRGTGPPLSSWNGTRLRFVGLDAYVPTYGTPAATFAENPSGASKLKYKRTFYVGLYNSATNHYSNGVKIGSIEPVSMFATQVVTANGSSPTLESTAYISVGDTVFVGSKTTGQTTVSAVSGNQITLASGSPAQYTPIYVVNPRLKYQVDDTKTQAGFYTQTSGAITADVNPKTVSVVDASRIRVGDTVKVGGTNPSESVVVLGLPSTTSFTAIFTQNHASGSLVTLDDANTASDFGVLDAPTVGDISLTGINIIERESHDGAELAELKYVIYCTLDGGEVPYLVLKSDGTGPETTTASSITLNLNAIDGTGNIVDVTKEMPRENFPPRPLNQLCYAGGRLYGSLRAGGSGGATASESAGKGSPFTYVVTDKDLAAVVFSAAADDVQDRDFVGVPEESWPLVNKKFTPNGEVPIIVQQVNELDDVLVITKNGTFILRETADLLHEWTTISVVDGILDVHSFAQTIYGPMWVTQNRQIVVLRPGTTTLVPLSEEYASLLQSVTSASADYLRDPNHQIDRYQVWIGSGKSICHDFYIEQRQGYPAWTTTNQSVDVARTMITASGNIHSIISIGGSLYAQEAHPITGIVPVVDAVAGGSDLEINGTWISQWTDYGETEIRKTFDHIDVLGDTHYSEQLGREAMDVSWYADLDSEEFILDRMIVVPQGDIDNQATQLRRFKAKAGNRFWYKFKIVLRGHSKEAGSLYFDYSADGDLNPNYYGAIFRAMVTVSGIGENRP